MNFQQQAEVFMSEISQGSDSVRPNTLHVYRSLLDARILPTIGKEDLSVVGNKTVKILVGRLAEAGLSPATISLAVTLVKQIVKSAVDEEGNYLYPVKWNPDFIKAPRVDPDDQKTPVTTRETLQEAISATNGEVKALVALLAGTGLRIGEALALKVGQDNGIDSFWHPETATLTIRTTLVNGKIQPSPKTRAGKRVVDLSPELNNFLRTHFEGRI